jgi:hypothetical protein
VSRGGASDDGPRAAFGDTGRSDRFPPEPKERDERTCGDGYCPNVERGKSRNRQAHSTDECRASGTDYTGASIAEFLRRFAEDNHELLVFSVGEFSRASGTGFVVDFDHEDAAVVDSPGIHPVQTSQASL